MKNLFTFLLVGIALSMSGQTKSSANSGRLSEGTPSGVGISAERLARIETMCSEAVDKGEVPGIVALVARGSVGFEFAQVSAA
jgi:hypothetical protein